MITNWVRLHRTQRSQILLKTRNDDGKSRRGSGPILLLSGSHHGIIAIWQHLLGSKVLKRNLEWRLLFKPTLEIYISEGIHSKEKDFNRQIND